MSPQEFKERMAQCHRLSDLLAMFNAHWSDVAGTLEEFEELRRLYLARYEQLSEDGVAHGSNKPAVFEQAA